MGHTTTLRFRGRAGQVEQDLPWLSGAFTKSADGFDNVTDPLTHGDLGQTSNAIADFARRQFRRARRRQGRKAAPSILHSNHDKRQTLQGARMSVRPLALQARCVT